LAVAGRLESRSAIITGSGAGIGRSIARVFASEGARVLIVDIDEGSAAQTAEELRRAGREASPFRADVSDRSQVEAMTAAAVDLYGSIDILCNNAATFLLARIEEMSEDVWDRDHSVNLKGPFLAIKSCLPHMRQRNYGRIVLISSITGPVTGLPRHAHYGASKAGLLGFMRSAAIEFARQGIAINAVLPGTIGTESLLTELDAAAISQIEASIPMRRLGEPKEIARAALFLASDDASFITGQTLIVDGGQTLPESNRALAR
jgi:3-oxoacyl-[acyl-carrier protein] reductase